MSEYQSNLDSWTATAAASVVAAQTARIDEIAEELMVLQEEEEEAEEAQMEDDAEEAFLLQEEHDERMERQRRQRQHRQRQSTGGGDGQSNADDDSDADVDDDVTVSYGGDDGGGGDDGSEGESAVALAWLTGRALYRYTLGGSLRLLMRGILMPTSRGMRPISAAFDPVYYQHAPNLPILAGQWTQIIPTARLGDALVRPPSVAVAENEAS
eukprot:g1491.t1